MTRVAALIALIAVVVGAVVTSLERPIAATPSLQIPAAAHTFEFWHQIAGGLALLAALILAVSVRSQPGWIALAAGILDALLGISHQALASILHALLAQVFFGCIVAAAVMTSNAWRLHPITDTWKPSLRSLSIAVPAIILLQTALGASYRYHAIGVLWHIMNAMIVLLLVLIVCILLIRHFPEHPTLKPAAIALAVVTSGQVFLGFTTFMMLLLFPESSLAVIITSVIHVATGALTFGASLVLSLLIRYNIRPASVTPGQ